MKTYSLATRSLLLQNEQNKSGSKETLRRTMTVYNHVDQNDTSMIYHQPHPVYLIIGTTLASVGIIGNIVTVLLVWCRKHLRSPTFVTFACLAFVDLIAIAVRFSILWFYRITTKMVDPKLFLSIYFTIGFITLHCSCGHIVLVASVRYVILSRPLLGFVLRHRDIFRYSALIWILSCVLGAGYGMMLLYFPNDSSFHVVEFSIGTYLLLGTILPLIILHRKKVYRLKRTLSNTRSSSKRMSGILLVITFVQVLSLAPLTIENLILLTNKSIDRDSIAVLRDLEYFYQVCLLLVSHGVNPIIFFAMSRSGREYAKKTMKYLLCKNPTREKPRSRNHTEVSENITSFDKL